MKTNKKAIVVALTNGVQEFTPEELELHGQFKENYKKYNELFNETFTPREYAEIIVKAGIDFDEELTEANVALAWAKMMSRHGKYTSLLNKLGNIIGENIKRFSV